MNKKIKTIGIIFGVLLILFIGFILFWNYYSKADNELFILPENYTGAVIVLFDKADGITEKFDKEGNRVLEIPPSGILKTKFKFQEGFRNISYQTTRGENLRYLWPSDKAWSDTLQNMLNDSIYVYKASYAKDYWFIVGKIHEIDSLQEVMTKKWEPYSEKVVLKQEDNIDNRK
jgi:hypothetical protein